MGGIHTRKEEGRGKGEGRGYKEEGGGWEDINKMVLLVRGFSVTSCCNNDFLWCLVPGSSLASEESRHL